MVPDKAAVKVLRSGDGGYFRAPIKNYHVFVLTIPLGHFTQILKAVSKSSIQYKKGVNFLIIVGYGHLNF